MKAVLIETKPFERAREKYLADDDYRDFQEALLNNPRLGDTISGTGGLRKVRWSLPSNTKGKSGGIRVIYYWFDEAEKFLMFTAYAKNEFEDLTEAEKKELKKSLLALLDEIGG